MNRRDIEKAQREGTHLAARLHGTYAKASEVVVTGFHDSQPQPWSGRKKPVRYWHLEVVSDPYTSSGYAPGQSIPRKSTEMIGPWDEYKSMVEAKAAELAREKVVLDARRLNEADTRAELRDLLDVHLPEDLRPQVRDDSTSVHISHRALIRLIRFFQEEA